MEEPVHYLLTIILTADGTYIREILEFSRSMTLMECLDFGDGHREAVSVYNEEQNRWIMNNGSGDWFGFECIQDPGKKIRW